MPVGSRYHYCERYGGDPLSDVDDVSMADAQSELSDDEPEPLIVSDIATPTPKTGPVHPVKRGAGRPLKKSKLPTSTKADTKKASARNGTETGLQDGKSDASISGEDDQDCASGKRHISPALFLHTFSSQWRDVSDCSLTGTQMAMILSQRTENLLFPSFRARGACFLPGLLVDMPRAASTTARVFLTSWKNLVVLTVRANLCRLLPPSEAQAALPRKTTLQA